MQPDFDRASKILDSAFSSGRNSLFEYEVYELLSSLTIGNPPSYYVIENQSEAGEKIDSLPGEKVVLKIIHPEIAHKSDVGGVKICQKDKGEEISRELFGFGDGLKGILAVEYVDAKTGFGNELFIGMRYSREFGPVINAGLGGIDTELYAGEIPKGRSGITISPGVLNDSEFVAEFQKTIIYEALTGKLRGRDRIVEDGTISELLATFHAFVWLMSPMNPDAEYWLDEFEINPFLIRDKKFIPIDGLLRFRKPGTLSQAKPIEKMENLLKPRNIGMIGVSGKGMNMGRVILKNIVDCGFDRERIGIVKPGDDEIDGVKCFPSIAELPQKYDLFVLSVGAEQVPETIRELVENDKTESIILITGGMGEKKGSESIEKEIANILQESRKRIDKGPIMVGGNSLGIISRPGGYDTMFVPDWKLPKNATNPIGNRIALLSQSGAYMITRMSRLDGLYPRYAVSTGNQVDLGVADFLEHIGNDPEIKVFGCYVEGFGQLEGLDFADTARRLTRKGIDVVVYKAGRLAEGRKAASGHTAAIAGDWDIAESVLSQAGCIVARSFDEWTDFLMLSASLSDRNFGDGRIVAISNAGFETVGIADNLRSRSGEAKLGVTLAELSAKTIDRISEVLREFKLDGLVNINNPLDLTPMARCHAHVEILKALENDTNVDMVLHCCVPLSPAMNPMPSCGPYGEETQNPCKYECVLIEQTWMEMKKPVVVVRDSGSMYEPMNEHMRLRPIPVFKSADRAIRIIGRWLEARKTASKIPPAPVGMV